MKNEALSVAMLSTSPGSDAAGQGGVAIYTTGLCNALAPVCDITVLAQSGARPQSANPRVVAVWKPNSATTGGRAYRAAKTAGACVLHAQHELFLYGSPVTTLLFPLWVRYWARRLPTIVTIHGVFGPDQIDAALIGSRAPSFLTGPIRRIIGWVFSAIAKAEVLKVVHEPTLRDRLVAFGAPPDSVFVIPHPSFDASLYTRPAKEEARRRLGVDSAAQVILSWGFFNTYKGFDRLLDGFERFRAEHPKAVLVLGAGEHPKLAGNRAYRESYDALRRRAEAIDGVRFAGFIADEDVPDYIAAADVAVFPYTQYLAASGPVSHALGFGVPVLLSSVFADAPELLKFEPDGPAIAGKLDEFFHNPQRFIQAASEMGTAMSDVEMRAAYAALYSRAAGLS